VLDENRLEGELEQLHEATYVMRKSLNIGKSSSPIRKILGIVKKGFIGEITKTR